MQLTQEQLVRRAATIALLLVFLVLGVRIVQPFLAAIAWGGILAFVTWPIHTRIRAAVGGRATLGALLSTVLLGLVLVLPMVWVILLLQAEVSHIYQTVAQKLTEGGIDLPEALRRLPVAGEQLQAWVDRYDGDPARLRTELAAASQEWRGQITALLGGVGRNIAKFGFAIITAFFCYRDGEAFVRQLRSVLQRFLGTGSDNYLQAVGATTRAVVYGIVLTALAQGLLAGVGYWFVGLDSPVFLAAVTALVALIPFGTPFAWGSIAAWMALTGDVGGGLILAAWGTFVVSWVDNIVRPLAISSATRVPFVLVMFGVLGGLATFGMVGLFVGPVILAVLLAVWREWLEQARQQEEPPTAER